MIMDHQNGAGLIDASQVHPNYNDDLDEQPIDDERCLPLKHRQHCGIKELELYSIFQI